MKKQYLNLIGLALFILSMVSIFSFYPGAMTWDSMDQLRQARAGEYSDWQPPTMAYVWSWLLPLTNGPGGMFLLQCGLLWATVLILYKTCIREGYSYGMLFLLIPIAPWILNFEFTLWKDVAMAYSWGLATAICLYYKDHQKFPKTAALLVSALFIYGALVRTNSLSAGIFLLPFLINSILKVHTIKSTIFFIFISSAIIGLAHLCVTPLIGAKKANSVSYVMFDDIVALKVRGVEVPVSFLSPDDMNAIKQCEYLNVHEVGAAFCLSNEKFTTITQAHYQELKDAWIQYVPRNILEYGAFRLNAFLNFIRSPSLPPYYPTEFRVMNQPYEPNAGIRSVSPVEKYIADYVTTSIIILPELFKPYSWLITSILLIGAFQLSRHCRAHSLWLLPLSGLSYTTSYLLITPANDLRYAYWMIFITTLSIVLFINIHFKKPATSG
ncbi:MULTISPECIES: hypothetical protein [Pseudomonas]|uniref:Glycosyltransferase RgtA/B/C/D-like domain-containing protein n=1 Tax=Pseudomonas synxantha TaxID=47883 RepID=A0A5D3G1J2_9PSED|nr:MULTISPECIES: hypothetical protein [Pseudomonas]MCK3826000.1 hypothetical protein [Pseudomonas sp. W2Aug9]MCK3831905.1 hypothetical protein [Pseudomonas fluorescens]TYK54106.1 hypothetical protein FXO26_29335 [Pseudomonas synxantha]TYK59806.1 hypothetical protein FXO26_01455 [Pseudomonas synxantha]